MLYGPVTCRVRSRQLGGTEGSAGLRGAGVGGGQARSVPGDGNASFAYVTVEVVTDGRLCAIVTAIELYAGSG